MNRIELERTAPNAPNSISGLGQTARHLIFGLFLIDSVLVWARLMHPGLWFGGEGRPEALLIVLATATTLAELARRLPFQNVVAVALVIAAGAGAAQCMSVLTGIPFGRVSYTRSQLFNPQLWTMPLLWLVMLLNARGAVRLALQPWRETTGYGYWLLGLSVALVLLMDFGLEPFATRVNHYWSWGATVPAPHWYGAPWVNFLGWAVCALAILAFVTPFLINKAPSSECPSLHPLVVWLVLNALILTGILAHHLWLPAALIIGHCLVIAVIAGIGSRHDKCRV